MAKQTEIKLDMINNLGLYSVYEGTVAEVMPAMKRDGRTPLSFPDVMKMRVKAWEGFSKKEAWNDSQRPDRGGGATGWSGLIGHRKISSPKPIHLTDAMKDLWEDLEYISTSSVAAYSTCGLRIVHDTSRIFDMTHTERTQNLNKNKFDTLGGYFFSNKTLSAGRKKVEEATRPGTQINGDSIWSALADENPSVLSLYESASLGFSFQGASFYSSLWYKEKVPSMGILSFYGIDARISEEFPNHRRFPSKRNHKFIGKLSKEALEKRIGEVYDTI